MKKFVNLRFWVVCACMLAAGIASGYALKFCGINFAWVFLFIPLAALIILPFTFKTKNYLPLVFFCSACLFFIVGCLYTIYNMNQYELPQTDSARYYTVSGTVYDIGYTDDGNYLLLNDVRADNDALGGSLKLYLTENEDIAIGSRIYFSAYINEYNLFNYGELNYNAYNNIKYNATVYDDIFVREQFSVFGTIRSRINYVLFEHLDKDTAAICYAMLLGNTDRMDQDTLNNFRYGGIAHIFAISGLHIGILFGVSEFVLHKVLGVTYRKRKIITILLVFFYCGVCGFTLSSLRAAIMCSITNILLLFQAADDPISSLSIAAIIIMLMNPLNLFSTGFQLSICAVGGINCFSNRLYWLLRKIKLPKNNFLNISTIKLMRAVSYSFGAQVGTLPILLSTFGYLSTAGLLLNVLVIPIMSAFFTFMFIGIMFAAAYTGLAYLIVPIFTMPVQATSSFLIGIGFENSIISGFGSGIFIPIYFICALAITDKFNIDTIKRLVAITVALVITGLTVLSLTHLPINGYKVTVAGYSNGGVVIIKSAKGTVLIVSDYVNPSRTADILNEYYSVNLAGVIFLGDIENIMYFDDIGANCKDMYSYILNIPIQPFLDATVHYEQNFSVGGVEFEYLDEYNLTAKCDNIDIGICSDEVKIVECDLLISVKENYYCDASNEVYFGLKGMDLNTYEAGPITLWARDSSLKLLTKIPNR